MNDLTEILQLSDLSINTNNIIKVITSSESIEYKIKKIQKIYNRGYNINIQDEEGNTALHYACEYENVVLVKHLIRYGSNCYIKNNYNITPLNVAVDRNCINIVQVLTGIYYEYDIPSILCEALINIQ